MNRNYDFHLPYFKQGDDLRRHLSASNNDPSAACLAHAKQLEAAAKLLRKAASVFAEVPGVVINADTHHIGVEGPSDQLDAFLEGEDAFLSPEPDYG